MIAFPAPDTLAPYVEKIVRTLNQSQGMTVKELRRETKFGEDVVRAALDRLASLKQVHCALRESKKRGSPPREYRPGPCPIVVTG